MSVIEITATQAAALADLAEEHGLVAIHQVAPSGDVYVTPHNASTGFRIAPDGTLSDIGHTLPAP
ncbi:MAG TPA: hypothetical protein VIE38_10790 [Gaiellaceae bacterium]|jgi:hypothetical protein